MGANETKTIYRTLPCRLTQEDIDQKNRYNGQDYNTLLDMAAKQAEIKKIMQKRNSEIHRGEEDRDVACLWEYDTKTEMKLLRRTDTAEVVAVESMTPAELQEARQTSFDVFSDTLADIAGKGATTIETGLAWAGRRPGPEKGPDGLPVSKLIAAMLRAYHAVWNGQRWLALSDEPDRSDAGVLVRHNEGEELLPGGADVWVSRWKLDPPAAEPAPKQLPPAPSPSTAELRAELDADEILFDDLAADLRSLGKLATAETFTAWGLNKCLDASDYVKLMDQQRIGVDVGDPVCPEHVAALPEYHRGEPGEIVDAEFDDSDNNNSLLNHQGYSAADRFSYEDAWEAEEAHRNPIDAIVAESGPTLAYDGENDFDPAAEMYEPDAIPEHIDDPELPYDPRKPEPPAKPRERKAGGKAKGKAGNASKGRKGSKKPAAE